MITDNKLYMADRQQFTSTAMCKNCIDMRVETTFGGRDFYAVLVSHGQATHAVQMAIVTSDSAAFTDFTTLVTSGKIDATGLTRGAIYALALPRLPMGLLKRYVGVKMIVDGTVDGTGTLDDLCTILDKPALTSDVTTIPATIPAGKTMPDQPDYYSVVISDSLHEYKPWKFLDVAYPWDPSTAPELVPSGSEGSASTNTGGSGGSTESGGGAGGGAGGGGGD